jgi:uncharacterized protein YfiM (DUF2279 family)
MTRREDLKLQIRHEIREWMTTAIDMNTSSQRQMYRDAVMMYTSKLTLSELKEMFSILTGATWS